MFVKPDIKPAVLKREMIFEINRNERQEAFDYSRFEACRRF